MASIKYKKTPSPSAAGPRRAYATKGGIKSGNKQGNYGRTWWGDRWLKVFEPSAVEARLSQGRSYAKDGQVLTLDVESGIIKGTVQGNELKPFEVTIEVQKISEGFWEEAEEQLRDNSKVCAALLAGKLPEDIDSIFGDYPVSLFPNRLKHIKSSCTCGDWANPCRHTAAVYYVMAEQIDRDPFILFAIRGRSRLEVINVININDEDDSEAPSSEAFNEALPTSTKDFWHNFEDEQEVTPSGVTSAQLPTDALIVARLGPFPFWRGEAPIFEEVRLLYRSASHKAWELLLPEDREPNHDDDVE
jgi:uncharacterized Zn finger protein